jgi:hypothetical protein
MTLHDRLMLLRAIQGENIADTNDPYPAATASVDARAVELYKLIEDLHRGSSRRWWWPRDNTTY